MLLPEGISSFSRIIITQAGTYIILLYRLFKGLIDISLFTTTVNATLQFASNFSQAVNGYTELKENILYIEDFIWALEYKPNIEKEKDEVEGLEFNKLEIKNVKFQYPKTDKLAIDDISLEIKKGQRIAIVGDNGSGKTTLMKLLLSFYYPTEGEILINGYDYKELSTKQIRSKYSIVFQDFQI